MNTTILRKISYSLPDALHGHINTVVPTTYFGSPLTEGMKPRMHSSTAVEGRTKAGPRELVTGLSSRNQRPPVEPAFVRWLYKTMGYVPTTTDPV
jgi:tripeptidyl-peptidase-1